MRSQVRWYPLSTLRSPALRPRHPWLYVGMAAPVIGTAGNLTVSR